jgi:hypothetical protein
VDGGFARRKLLGILSASWLAQACYAVTRLGIPDLLAAGPRTAADLAVASGAHPQALRRLLRALAAGGVLRRTTAGEYELTAVGELLRSDVPGSLHQTAIMDGEEVYRAFAEIMYTARTGRPAFDKVFGTPFYAYLDADPAAADTFHAAMGGAGVPAAWAGCDLTGIGSLVDVGGGTGGLLAQTLAAHPELRGILLELPDAIRRARPALAEAGVADRVELVEGSFFDGVPAGADAYLLSRVLHNWTDDRAATILRRLRDTMPAGARLFVLEEFLPEDDDGPAAGLVDLLMLVTLEGHDRTEAGYRALLEKAGFTVLAARPGGRPGVEGVIEATRDADG